jgi:drug/metabolite transporter (DMT)-like permease
MRESHSVTQEEQRIIHSVVNSPVENVTSPSTSAKDRITIVLAILALYLIWGSTYLGMRIAEESFPGFLMSGIRFLAAGGILYIVLRLRHVPSPSRAQWGGSVIVGLLLVVGGNGAVSFAEQWVASGLAAVAIAATPVWISLILGLMGKWPRRIEWFGIVLGLVGVLLLNLGNGMWANPQGAIVLLFAPICWSLGSALSGRLPLPSGLMASAAQMIVGGVASFIIALLLGERMHSVPTLKADLALLYLIFFGSIIAFSAYGFLLRRVRPALATSYAYVNPVVAVCLGALVAGEHITPLGVVAMLVILTGVALVTLTRKPT